MTFVRVVGSGYPFPVDADLATTKAAVEAELDKRPGDYKVDTSGNEVVVSPDRWTKERLKLAREMESHLSEQFADQPA